MQINFNYSDINSIDTTREEVDGIYSNAFPPFSQNSLGCRYGFFKKHGRVPVPAPVLYLESTVARIRSLPVSASVSSIGIAGLEYRGIKYQQH